jgi:NitT/TauT family transport system ATP-binding protein
LAKLDIRNISLTYGGAGGDAHTALADVNFSVEKGEFASIVGPSGCGKSTMLSLLAGLIRPTGGEILLDGEPIRGTGLERSVVFQHYSLFPWMSAKKNIVFALKQTKGIKSGREAAAVADKYLELVGLADFRNKFPGELSGGMQQRVAIARALAVNSDILLMDEPFGAVDTKNRVILQELLIALWGRGEEKLTVVFVTHDIDEAILLSDKIVVMAGLPGKVRHEISIPFSRPRKAERLAELPEYSIIRNRIVNTFYWDVADKIGNWDIAL